MDMEAARRIKRDSTVEEVKDVLTFLGFLTATIQNIAGENIYKVIEAELSNRSIPFSNCLSLGRDNASVMTGKPKGVSAEMIATAANALTPDAKLSHEISRDGETWTMATTTPLGSRFIRFKLGQEFETKTLDGRTVKCVTSLDGNTLVEIQTGDGFESKNVRTPKGDQMTTTLSGNGVTCTRVYKRLN